MFFGNYNQGVPSSHIKTKQKNDHVYTLKKLLELFPNVEDVEVVTLSTFLLCVMGTVALELHGFCPFVYAEMAVKFRLYEEVY